MHVYIRLRPFAPRQGNQVQRLHYSGTLFIGGERPTWYRVSEDFGNQVAPLKQDSGAPMFDVVSEADKISIDQVENARHMAALGIAAATVAAPMQVGTVNLEQVRTAPARRAAAIPTTAAPAPAVAAPLPPPPPAPPAPDMSSAPDSGFAAPDDSDANP